MCVCVSAESREPLRSLRRQENPWNGHVALFYFLCAVLHFFLLLPCFSSASPPSSCAAFLLSCLVVSAWECVCVCASSSVWAETSGAAALIFSNKFQSESGLRVAWYSKRSPGSLDISALCLGLWMYLAPKLDLYSIVVLCWILCVFVWQRIPVHFNRGACLKCSKPKNKEIFQSATINSEHWGPV